MKTILFFAGLLFCGLVGLLGTADAVTYKYIDKAGMICFADDLQAIPEQYRSQAVLIEGALQETPDSTAATGTAAPAVMQSAAMTATSEADQPQSDAASTPVYRSFSSRPLSIRLLITACVGLGLLALLAVVSRQLTGEKEKRVRTFTKKGSLAFFLVYLILAHGRDVLTIVRMADRTVYEVQQQSARKGQRAAEGIKRLDALFQEMQAAEESFKKDEATADNR
jgi:hypothetical protein